MKNNKKLESVFNDCLELLLSGSGTVEQCLERYPGFASELEPLLKTALSVNQAVQVEPAPEFRARARYQLQLKMAENKLRRRIPAWSLQPRWAIGLVAAMAVFVLGTGTVFAADSSLPGNPLYPIKLATEDVRIKLAGSEIKKAKLLAVCADRRMTEMSRLIENGQLQHIEAVAGRYSSDVTMMSNMPFSENARGQTATMMAPAPESVPAQPSASVTVGGMSRETTPPMMGMQGTTSPPPNTVTRGKSAADNHKKETVIPPATIKLTKTEADKETLKKYIADNALRHTEKLKEFYDKVPDEYKPAVSKMIDASAQSYQRALEDHGN